MQTIRPLLAIILLTSWLWATPSKPHIYSTVPASENTFVNLSPNLCDSTCLEELLAQERLFSFMARYRPMGQTRPLAETHQRYAAFFNARLPQSDRLQVAVLVPSEIIGRYSAMITNSVSAYLLHHAEPFEMQVFDSLNEDPRSLTESIRAIEKAGFAYVIAAVTTEGVANLDRIPTHLEIFIPTVNKEELSFYPKNHLFFGGIDYARQLEALGQNPNRGRMIIFDEPVPLSQRISTLARSQSPSNRITINNPRVNYTRLFQNERVDHGTTLLLNTQPVRTSLILSQITYNDINITSALSTQINFNPMILTLTQRPDVQHFFVASSIGPSDERLREMGKLFHEDIRYNWVPYATAALTSLIVQRQSGDLAHRAHDFELSLQNNQTHYPVTIYQVRGNKFTPVQTF